MAVGAGGADGTRSPGDEDTPAEMLGAAFMAGSTSQVGARATDAQEGTSIVGAAADMSAIACAMASMVICSGRAKIDTRRGGHAKMPGPPIGAAAGTSVVTGKEWQLALPRFVAVASAAGAAAAAGSGSLSGGGCVDGNG
jgi:hypothetical protein